MVHPLAAAMALYHQRTTEQTNRTINTIGGWTFPGNAPGTLALSSRLPCSLDISNPEHPDECYWCGESIESHWKKETE